MKINKICCALVLSLATFSSYAVEIEKFDTSWDGVSRKFGSELEREELNIDEDTRLFFKGLEPSYINNPRPISSVALKKQIIKLIEKSQKLTDNDFKNIRNLLGKPSREIISQKQLTYGWLFEDGDVIVIREFSNQDKKVSLFKRLIWIENYYDKNFKDMSNYFVNKQFQDKIANYWKDIKRKAKREGALYCLPFGIFAITEHQDIFLNRGTIILKDSLGIRELLNIKPHYYTEGAKTWILDNGYILSYDGTKKFDKDGDLCFVFEIGLIDKLDDDRNFNFQIIKTKTVKIDKSFTETYVLKALKSITIEAVKAGEINVIPAEKLKIIEKNPNSPELGIRLIKLSNNNEYNELYKLMHEPSYRIENGLIPIHICVFDNGYIYTSIFMEETNKDGKNYFIVQVSNVDELKKKFGLDFDKLEKVYTKNKKLK
ncbi:hypothetical protein AAEX28_15875 [Lentisphaerota bacterium WC36G]|nr:hypothetical protein LJT99_02635 [Lentisphaerae bacterium WC36]